MKKGLRFFLQTAISLRWMSIEVLLKYIVFLVSMIGIVATLISADLLSKNAQINVSVSQPSIFIHPKAFQEYYNKKGESIPNNLEAEIKKFFVNRLNIPFPSISEKWSTFGGEKYLKELRLHGLENHINLKEFGGIRLNYMWMKIPYEKIEGRSLLIKTREPVGIFPTSRFFHLVGVGSPNETFTNSPQNTGYTKIWKNKIIPFIKKNLTIDQQIQAFEAFLSARRFASILSFENTGSLDCSNLKVLLDTPSGFGIPGEILSYLQLSEGWSPREEGGNLTFLMQILKPGETKQIVLWSSEMHVKKSDIRFTYDWKREIDRKIVVLSLLVIIVIFVLVCAINIYRSVKSEIAN